MESYWVNEPEAKRISKRLNKMKILGVSRKANVICSRWVNRGDISMIVLANGWRHKVMARW